ncbi:MAG: transketolase [Rhodospirillales bacterium]|nr:transketolase [Rhodospirillales bacterium]
MTAVINPGSRPMANAIRALAMDAVEKAKSGHPGMPMGMADAATVLFTKFLKFDPKWPQWPDRDRFVLSAGHGSMLQYALLYLSGYEKISLENIKNFRQLHSHTPGHPEIDVASGIETTTGPLGQGIATAVGMALAERHLNARFGDSLVDHHTYVIASDGDLMEGISHEACALAGHLKLSRLIVLYDDNGISIDGETSLSFGEDTTKRFEAYGWDVQSIDGHDPAAVETAISAALKTTTPSLIRCKTVIGFGAPTKAGKESCHGSPLGAEEIAGARAALGWSAGPFEIPDDILSQWRSAGARNQSVAVAWKQRYDAQGAGLREALEGDAARMDAPVIAALKEKFRAEKPVLATRAASGKVLESLIPAIPELVGGSADLTGSVNTRVKGMETLDAGNYAGRYIHYGVREHGMAAMMNGMALHGGIIPYSGTFLQFADYCRPAIRLSALMRQRVVYVMTHDSIGLGEDGPTHQPVEHLASLRAMPNLNVFRPCDPIEAAECWEIALGTAHTPSVLSLSRQNLPFVREAPEAGNLCAKGGYVLKDCAGAPRVVLIATGSEIAIALEAQGLLEKEGIPARVVSMPCLDLFAAQPEEYRASVLGPAEARLVVIEAGIRQGWDGILGASGAFIGMTGFGDSAPAPALYAHFGITAAAVLEALNKA